MNDYKELIERLKSIGKYLNFDKSSCVYLAADAIEQLVHERFVIGEALVAVSKYEIAPVDALEKIRKVLRGEI